MTKKFITPSELGEKKYFVIPIADNLSAMLLYSLRQMGEEYNWQVVEGMAIEPVVQEAREAILRLQELEQVIEDVRLNSDGLLEKRVNGVWLSAGDVSIISSVSVLMLDPSASPTATIDGDTLELEIPRGYTGAQGIQGIQGIPGQNGYNGVDGEPGYNSLYDLPDNQNPTNHDKYCQAAWALAKEYSDSLGDLLEIIDATETITGEAIENALAGLTAIIPPLSVVTESIIEFVHEGVFQPAIDFVRSNTGDEDAVQLAANQMYCAMLASDDMENFWDEVQWDNAFPASIFNIVSGKPVFQTFGEMIDYIFGTLDGTQVGWFILAYGKFLSFSLIQQSGTINPTEQIVAAAANTASLRSSNACEACPEDPFCHLFDFSSNNGGWIANDGGLGGTFWNGVYWTSSSSSYTEILRNVPGGAEITSVKITLFAQMSGNYRLARLKINGSGIEDVLPLDGTEYTFQVDMLNVNSIGVQMQGATPYTDNDGDVKIASIEVCGIGENPFL